MNSTNIDLLKSLRDAIRSCDSSAVESLARQIFPNPDSFRMTEDAAAIVNSYHGALEAAERNHNLWFPDMPVNIIDMTPESCGAHGWCVKINWPYMEWQDSYTARPPEGYSFHGYADNAARAWLYADLKAKIAIGGHRVAEAV